MKFFYRVYFHTYRFFLQLFCKHKWIWQSTSVVSKDKIILVGKKQYKTNYKKYSKAKVFICSECDKVSIRIYKKWHI